MKVSVVIPVFNKAPWLRASIGSVLRQSFSDLEVIAVDDASTDDSLAVLRSFDDPRLRIIALGRNLGPAGAAQRGHDAATGAYIARADADDELEPQRIERQVAFMEAHPEVGASGSFMRILGRDELRTALLADADIRAWSLFRIPIYQPTAIYRRNVLLEAGVCYVDEWPRYGEDWLFQHRLLRATRLANLPEPLVRYRLGDQNASAQRDVFEGLRGIMAQVLAFHGLPHGPEELRHHLHAMGAFPQPLRPADVAGLRRYLRALAASASAAGLADAAALQRAMHGAWDALAFQLPRFGWRAALAYLIRDGRPSLAKWRYLAASFLKGSRYEPRTERIGPGAAPTLRAR